MVHGRDIIWLRAKEKQRIAKRKISRSGRIENFMQWRSRRKNFGVRGKGKMEKGETTKPSVLHSFAW